MSAGAATAMRAAVYAVLAALWLGPFLVHPQQCPFGLHDWGWPCFNQQGHNWLIAALAPRNESNLGGPNPLPVPNPVVLPFLALSPQIGLRLLLFISIAAAGVGADVAAARIFGVASAWARLGAGMLYMTSPFWATKLVAGHEYFMLGAALVPLALVALERIPTSGRRAWAACALCIAAAFAQTQVGLMLLALVPLLAIGRIKPTAWLGLCGVALVTWSPVIFAGLTAFRAGALESEAQLRIWTESQSLPLLRVLDGTWYFTNYYGQAAPLWNVIAWQWVAPLCVVVAALRAGAPRRLAVAAIIFGLFAAGMNGPLKTPVIWLIQHVSAASLWRELYDLLALAPLVVAGGAAIGFEWLLHGAARASKLSRTAAAAATGCLAIVLVAPAIAGCAARLVPLVDRSRWMDDVHAVADSPGFDRVLWLPTQIPLGPKGTPGGADPFYIAIGSHPSAFAYHPAGILAYAAALADRGGTLPEMFARRLGIGAVIVRDGVVSRRLANAHYAAGAPNQPPAHPPQHITEAGPLAMFKDQIACEPDLRSDMIGDWMFARCDLQRWRVAPREDVDASRDDPGRDWVSGQRWAALDPELANPRWPVLATRSRTAYAWMTPQSGVLWIYAPSGATLDGRFIGPGRHWRLVPLAGRAHELRGTGRGIVGLSISLPRGGARLSPGRTPLAITIAHGPIFQGELAPFVADRYFGRYVAQVPPHRSAVLILRENWSPYWHAKLDGYLNRVDLGPAQLVNGYAAGWRLPQYGAFSRLTITYALTAPYLMLVVLAGLTWLALFALALSPQPATRSRRLAP